MKAKHLITFLEKYPDMEVWVGDPNMIVISHPISTIEKTKVYSSKENRFVDVINIVLCEVRK